MISEDGSSVDGKLFVSGYDTDEEDGSSVDGYFQDPGLSPIHVSIPVVFPSGDSPLYRGERRKFATSPSRPNQSKQGGSQLSNNAYRCSTVKDIANVEEVVERLELNIEYDDDSQLGNSTVEDNALGWQIRTGKGVIQPNHDVSTNDVEIVRINSSLTRRPMVKPREYSGITPWDEYQLHFCSVQSLNGWSDEIARDYLMVSLSGAASEYLWAIAGETKLSWTELQAKLKRRFGSTGAAAVHRSQLRTLRRKFNQSLSALGQEVRRITRLAYPSVNNEAQELLAVDHFRDALTSSTERLFVYQGQSTTLDDAVKAALRGEAFEQLEKREHTLAPKDSRAKAWITTEGDVPPSEDTTGYQQGSELEQGIRLILEELQRMNQLQPVLPPYQEDVNSHAGYRCGQIVYGVCAGPHEEFPREDGPREMSDAWPTLDTTLSGGLAGVSDGGTQVCRPSPRPRRRMPMESHAMEPPKPCLIPQLRGNLLQESEADGLVQVRRTPIPTPRRCRQVIVPCGDTDELAVANETLENTFEDGLSIDSQPEGTSEPANVMDESVGQEQLSGTRRGDDTTRKEACRNQEDPNGTVVFNDVAKPIPMSHERTYGAGKSLTQVTGESYERSTRTRVQTIVSPDGIFDAAGRLAVKVDKVADVFDRAGYVVVMVMTSIILRLVASLEVFVPLVQLSRGTESAMERLDVLEPQSSQWASLVTSILSWVRASVLSVGIKTWPWKPRRGVVAQRSTFEISATLSCKEFELAAKVKRMDRPSQCFPGPEPPAMAA